MDSGERVEQHGDDMQPGYEIPPSPIGRPPYRRLSILLAAVVVLLGLVVAKPWAQETARPIAQVEPSAAVPTPSVAVPAPLTAIPAPFSETPPAWPAASTPTALAALTAAEAEGALGALAVYSGTWGVGDAGAGPRMLREESWVDWSAVKPVVGADVSMPFATLRDDDVCAGIPTIYDRPSLVAVTAPSALVPDWRLVGWWTDGVTSASLEGSIRQVSPAGNRGISYLERTDRDRWPPGRYEFHVVAGSSRVGLTVCLTRRG